jgi:hypothetical protein
MMGTRTILLHVCVQSALRGNGVIGTLHVCCVCSEYGIALYYVPIVQSLNKIGAPCTCVPSVAEGQMHNRWKVAPDERVYCTMV